MSPARVGYRAAMPRSFTVTVDVDVPAETAWELVGDPLGPPRWYPLYLSARMEGDERVLERGDGAVVRERILRRDDAERVIEYAITAGLPLTEHRAEMRVEERDPGASRVVWTTEAAYADPAIDPEERLADRQRDALGLLKAALEGARGYGGG